MLVIPYFGSFTNLFVCRIGCLSFQFSSGILCSHILLSSNCQGYPASDRHYQWLTVTVDAFLQLLAHMHYPVTNSRPTQMLKERDRVLIRIYKHSISQITQIIIACKRTQAHIESDGVCSEVNKICSKAIQTYIHIHAVMISRKEWWFLTLFSQSTWQQAWQEFQWQTKMKQ